MRRTSKNRNHHQHPLVECREAAQNGSFDHYEQPKGNRRQPASGSFEDRQQKRQPSQQQGHGLSPTLAATILNWQRFSANLIMSAAHSALKHRRPKVVVSDGEAEQKATVFQSVDCDTDPAMTGVGSAGHRRNSDTSLVVDAVDSLRVAPGPDDTPTAATTATADGEPPTPSKKAITRSPIARANAQLDLFANIGKEKDRSARYWTEVAAPGEHIWISTGAVSDCYIGEVDCSKAGEKLKCAACHIVVHDGCLTLLHRMSFNCKITYREAITNKFQKDHTVVVHHHWVHKWRQEGRCKHCGKSFQSKFLNRELVAISCSWCKTAYHNKHGCFTMTQIEEPCSLGPLRDIVVPPNWVIKMPPRRISTIRNRRVSTSYSCKRKKRTKKDRLFIVKTPQNGVTQDGPKTPLLIFVNPKSGGNKGAKILHNLYWLLNPRQVFDLSAVNGPKYGLEMYRKLLPKLKVVVCGGDGTVGWVLSTLDSLKWPVYPPIAVFPLGTGNDLAQTLGWGANFVDEPLSEALMAVAEDTFVVHLDRWKIETEANMDVCLCDVDDGAVPNLPLSVINNYFSIGADAQAALQFHESRTAKPEIFNSRIKNRIFYAGIGTQDLFKRTWKDLHEYIRLECDGVDISYRLQELKVHCLVFLNIPRYAGGTLPWGSGGVGGGGPQPQSFAVGGGGGGQSVTGMGGPGPGGGGGNGGGSSSGSQNPSPQHSPQFHPPSFSDGRLEVLGFTAATLAALQMGGRGERIAQCSEARLTTRRAIPAQVDGEPCKLAPSVVTIRFHSKVPMLQRIPYKSASRRASYYSQLANASQEGYPGSGGCAAPLYTSVLLRLPVAAVSRDEYDFYKAEPGELRARATHVGDITVEAEMDLDQVRAIVQRLLTTRRELPLACAPEWTFLDYASSDHAFRVDQAQEALQSVSDICNVDDCLLICRGGRGSAKSKLRDMRLVVSTEAVRLVLSSDEEATKI